MTQQFMWQNKVTFVYLSSQAVSNNFGYILKVTIRNQDKRIVANCNSVTLCYLWAFKGFVPHSYLLVTFCTLPRLRSE